MIVSDLESVVMRLLLGGVAVIREGRITPEVEEHLDGLLTWCSTPGVTEAAREEIAEGQEVWHL